MTTGTQPRQYIALIDYYGKWMRQADKEGFRGSLKLITIIILVVAANIAAILAVALIYTLILLPAAHREAAHAENHYDDNGKRLLNAYGLDPEQDIIGITRLVAMPKPRQPAPRTSSKAAPVTTS